MSIRAAIIDTNCYRFSCVRVEHQEHGSEWQARMGRGDAMSIESFPISGFFTMKTITMAIIRGRSALLVDCLCWIE